MHYLAVYSPRRHQQVPFPKGLVTLGTDPPRANPFVHSDDSLLAPWQLVLCRHGRHEVRLQNLGEAPLHVQGRVVAGGQELIARMPVTFRVGQTYCQAFEISDAECDPDSVAWLPSLGGSRRAHEMLGEEAIAEGIASYEADDALANWAEPTESTSLAIGLADAARDAQSPAPRTLARWLRALSAIHRRTAASSEFFQDAVRAVVEVGGPRRSHAACSRAW